jgi:hypothetical protein
MTRRTVDRALAERLKHLITVLGLSLERDRTRALRLPFRRNMPELVGREFSASRQRYLPSLGSSRCLYGQHDRTVS